MKARKLGITALIATIVTVSLAYASNIQTSDPGSSSDPLVSKSYVDKKVSEVLNVVSNGGTAQTTLSQKDTDDLMLQVDFLVKQYLSENGLKNDGNGSSSSSDSTAFKPVNVVVGQTLVGEEGSEIILRRGKAVAVTGQDGIVDLTSGGELFNGNAVSINHLLMVPRTDGRGVKVTENAWFTVKGGYSIVSQ